MKINKSPAISLIVVNFRTSDLLEAMMASFEKVLDQEGIRHEWIIVNNEAKQALTLPFLTNPVHLLQCASNEGFGVACNRGARRAHAPVLCFLNPDTEYGEGSFQTILNIFNQEKNTCFLGGTLINEKGKEEKWSFGKCLTFRTWILEKIQMLVFWKKQRVSQEDSVEWVSGASLFVRKECFDHVGGFDEGFFLYFEDMDLCRRITERFLCRGKRIATLRIIHRGGRSFNPQWRVREQKKHYYCSFARYAEKHLSFFEWYFFRALLCAIRFFRSV